MVLLQAPNSRRPRGKAQQDVSAVTVSSSDNWTQSFRKASAYRTRHRLTIWTLAVCGILAPVSLISSKAEDINNNSVRSQQQTPIESQPASPSTSQLLTPAQPVPATGDEAGARDGARPEIQNGATPATEASAAPTIGAQPADDTSKVAATSPQGTETIRTDAAGQAPDNTQGTTETGDSDLPKYRLRVEVDGGTRQTEVAVKPKMTVGAALVAIGVTVSAMDRCSPGFAETLRDGMTVHVDRIKAELQTRREPILPDVRYKPTPYLAPGQKQTVQEPQPGYYEITERVWSKNGNITKREFVSRKVAVWPHHRIIALGVKPHLMPGAVPYHNRYALAYRGGSPRDRMIKPADPNLFQRTKFMVVHATGYAPGRAGGSVGSRTCTGVRCAYGAVAVDPRVIPLGSKMYIEGYGYGFACDIGGAIKGKHIDLAFDSAHQAMRQGRKTVKVWLLGPA